MAEKFTRCAKVCGLFSDVNSDHIKHLSLCVRACVRACARARVCVHAWVACLPYVFTSVLHNIVDKHDLSRRKTTYQVHCLRIRGVLYRHC